MLWSSLRERIAPRLISSGITESHSRRSRKVRLGVTLQLATTLNWKDILQRSQGQGSETINPAVLTARATQTFPPATSCSKSINLPVKRRCRRCRGRCKVLVNLRPSGKLTRQGHEGANYRAEDSRTEHTFAQETPTLRPLAVLGAS